MLSETSTRPASEREVGVTVALRLAFPTEALGVEVLRLLPETGVAMGRRLDSLANAS